MLSSRAEYKNAIAIVKQVIDDWDPYGLLEMGCPDDEFSSEISDVVRHVHMIRSRQDAARVISEIFSQWFSPDDFPIVNCIEVGQVLYKTLVEARVIPVNSEGQA